MRRSLHVIALMVVVPQLCLVFAPVGLLHAQTVAAYQTTPDLQQALTPQPMLVFGGGGASALRIQVDDSVTYQQMDGFGASLTDSSAWLIQNTLTGEQRDRLMRQLFDRDAGIGLSFLRQHGLPVPPEL